MENQITSEKEIRDTAEPTPEPEPDTVLLAHPWLRGLEPYYVAWELIWPM